MKKISFIIAFFAIVPLVVSAAYTPRAGDLIKQKNYPAVYVIDATSTRHLFPNEAIFWTWYSGGWADHPLTVVTESEFDSIPLGDNITAKPGKKYIKFDNSPTIYGVDENFQFCPVRDRKVFSYVTIQSSFEADYKKNSSCKLALPQNIPSTTILNFIAREKKTYTPISQNPIASSTPIINNSSGGGSSASRQSSGSSSGNNSGSGGSGGSTGTTIPDVSSAQKYVIERVDGIAATASTKKVFPTSVPAQPKKCEYITDPDTGIKIRRMSDIADLEPGLLMSTYPYEGYPGRGLMNGYSKYSAANYTGRYVLAYGVQPWVNVLYDTTNCTAIKTVKSGTQGIGETWDIRWDMSGTPGTETTIYYANEMKVYSQDVLVPNSEKVVYDFSKNADYAVSGAIIGSEGHMDQANNARYRGVRLWNTKDSTWHRIVLLDLKEQKVVFGLPYRTMFDVSPSGKWFFYTGTDSSGKQHFYMRNIVAGNVVEVPVTTNVGHDGWGFDKNGNEVYLYQDNGNDWFSAFDPENNVRTNIINMVEMGWSLGQHMSRIMNVQKKGWLVMGTYTCDKGWAYNQIYMIEILPSTLKPRIWRVASTFNSWCWPVPAGKDPKTEHYFAESFPNIDFAGNNIYWGSNWNATDNLELYRAELPTNWEEYFDDGLSVSLSGVNNGEKIWATKTITATASSKSGISRVDFFVDGVKQGSDYSAPFEFTFDTTKVADGQHRFSVDAYSANLNAASAEITATVDNLTYFGLTKVKLQYGQPIAALGIASYNGAKDSSLTAQEANAGYYERGSATSFDYRFSDRVGLYWFDLSVIPATAKISSATMYLYSPSTNLSEVSGNIPIYVVDTLGPNDSISWLEGSGVGYYDQYGGTSFLRKSDTAGSKPTYTWSDKQGRFLSGDLFSAYGVKAGDMNFVAAAGEQKSTDLGTAVGAIIANGYKYEGFAIDKLGIPESGGRKDGIATKEYSDPNMRPALEIIYRTN